MGDVPKMERISITRKVTEKDLETISELSLDRNPLHFDNAFAKKTIFKKRIAHGMIGTALVSGALSRLGDGTILLTLFTNYVKPVYINDTLNCVLTVLDTKKRITTSNIEITNQTGRIVITGTTTSRKI